MYVNLLVSASIVGGLGLLFGVGLSVASKKFAVKVDERVAKVRDALPGANCGACGLTGCDAFAECLVKGECSINGCPVGGEELVNNLSQILGVKAEATVAMTARVMCSGTHQLCKQKFDYSGIEDCLAAAKLYGGPAACTYGCVGMGNCVRACPFDAIVMIDGLARIVESKCKACEKCVGACPKNIIKMVSKCSEYTVTCKSLDKGAVVRKNCNVGCIGCRKCSKVCPVNAITFNGTLAQIDPEKCINCGECMKACPTNAIKRFKCE
ncbi:UNVERIFIED_CONTAM: RnfABCDGE-type electron transport complex B subunit [Acetivibrio alkalicellulosi]